MSRELHPASEAYFEACEIALAELWSRGVDETKRTFRGRVLVDLLCGPGKGHRLGRVYPSSLGPVLVPAVEPRLARGPRSREWRREQGQPTRDPWLGAADWYLDDRRRVMPTGMEVALIQQLHDTPEMPASWVDSDEQIWCRCGARARPTTAAMLAEVAMATRTGKTRRLVVLR